ncbi:MAG: hypothetical protein KBS52_00240 [Clostridiales bacterium]|nr:hypothetical protein [Candidatus Equinaster intestinalis]
MKMEKAKLEVVIFNAQDIIATSFGALSFTASNFADGVLGNAVLEFSNGNKISISNYIMKKNGGQYLNSSKAAEALATDFNAATGLDPISATELKFRCGGSIYNLSDIRTSDDDALDSLSSFDGIYQWIAENSLWVKQ